MDKFDIGIVGLWYGLNYGSILTYYALYNAIDSMGYKSIMINKPTEMWSSKYTNPDTIANQFINKRCNVSEIKEPYYKWNELNDICNGFVVGSDVVWNYQICGNQSGQFFFLDFADDDKKKIAMASSFGAGYDAPERERILSQSYLKKFDYIGVREKEGIDICMEKFGVKADMVMDPVFLCKKSVYDALADSVKSVENEKFIATYILGPSTIKKDALEFVSRKFGLPLRCMPNPNNPNRFKDITGIPTVNEPSVPSVEEWLYYVKNCELFIGDSFHGLCFSLIFNKPFLIILDKNVGGLCRFTSLLGMLGLEDRIYYTDKPSLKTIEEILDTPIDYDRVNKILEEKAIISYEWLENAIKSEKVLKSNNSVLSKYSNAVEDKRILCSGCGACAAACPNKAIEMKENSEGFLNPVIDRNKCVDCGLCIRKCTDINPNYKNSISPECYAMMANDNIRKISSSGGMFTLTAEYIISKGGYVCGAAYRSDFSVEHIIVNKLDELQKLRGSKYMQSNTQEIFAKIKRLLDEDKYVLFTGMPCQTAGLYSFLGKDYEKLYTMELLCHGITSSKVFEKYRKDVLGDIKLKRLEFKEKEPWGWCAGVNAYFEDNSKYSVRADKDMFFRAYLNSLSKNTACSECKYSCLPRQADITIGDFWGINECDPELNDRKGTSVVLINNKKGDILFNEIILVMKQCRKEPLSVAIKGNPVIKRPYPLHKNRNFFFENMDKIDFSTLTEGCLSDNINGIKNKILRDNVPKDFVDLYYLAKTAVEKSKGRKIVTWTHGPLFTNILKKYFGVDIAFSVAKNPASINNSAILPLSALDSQKDNYYVVALHPDYNPQMLSELTTRGYVEMDDFIFRNHKPIVLTDYDLSKGGYEDPYGNTIEGNGVIGKVVFEGFNNRIYIGKNNKNTQNVKINLRSNTIISIGNDNSFNGEFVVNTMGRGEFEFSIKNKCVFLNSKTVMWGSERICSIIINEKCTFGLNLSINICSGKKIYIGRDSMFSHDVLLRSGDGHTIFDVNTRKNINSDYQSISESYNYLFIGEHVWVGQGATIMHNANIGNGSIVGAKSLVKGTYPNNCSIGGIPAKIIRKDVAWSRMDHNTDINSCDERYVSNTYDITDISGKKILVLGGTGLMGVRLVEKLLEKNCDVTIATRGVHQDSFGARVERLIIDRKDESSIINAFTGKQYDVVFDSSTYTADFIRYTLANIKCSKYILVSSAAIYDNKDNISLIRKEDMVHPYLVEYINGNKGSYKVEKMNSEHILCQEYGHINSAIVRVPAVIDEENLSQGSVTNRLYFYANHIVNEIAFCEHNLDRPCTFVRTTDEADFLIYLAETIDTGAYNIASNGMITMREIISYIEEKSNKKAIIQDGAEKNPFPFGGYEFDLSKAKQIGYNPVPLSNWIYKLLDKYIELAKNERA